MTNLSVDRVMHTFTEVDVGLSVRKPVQIVSHIHGNHRTRLVGLNDVDHPGPHWGPVRYVPKQEDHTPAHKNQFCMVTFIRNGTAIHHSVAHELPVQPLTAVVMPQGVAQRYTDLKSLHYTNLQYLSEWLVDDLRMWWTEQGLAPLFLTGPLFGRQLIQDPPVFTFTEAESKQVDSELGDLAIELARPQPSLLYLRGTLLRLFTYLSRSYVRNHPSHQHRMYRSEIWIAIKHIEKLLDECAPFSADEMADTCFLSRKRFSEIFKDATGLNPTTYYQRRRVQRSTQMLLDPEKSVSDVAYSLGFCDASHFSNLFKRYRGITPRQYRQLYFVD